MARLSSPELKLKDARVLCYGIASNHRDSRASWLQKYNYSAVCYDSTGVDAIGLESRQHGWLGVRRLLPECEEGLQLRLCSSHKLKRLHSRGNRQLVSFLYVPGRAVPTGPIPPKVE